jgi:hypothetical protein
MNPASLRLQISERLATFRQESGYPLTLWGGLALLNLVAQIILRRELMPGEFATFNTLLGLVGLMGVPLFALQVSFARFRPADTRPERLAAILGARVPAMQAFAVAWALIALLLLFPILALLHVPRSSLGLFALPNILLMVAAYFSATLSESQSRWRLWGWLLLAASLVRLLFLVILSPFEPWTETGLAAGWLAGLILLTPILRLSGFAISWERLRAILPDREFVIYLAATFSALLGLFLFTNGDRMVAQTWFGRPEDNNMGLVHWSVFDGYQTAGLLARALLWGTQPLLLLFFVERERLTRTTTTSLRIFWVYVAVLIAGAVALYLLTQPLAWIFGGVDSEATRYFLPSFAIAMVPMGLIQGIGVFSIASRRYPECFTLGGCSVVYTLLLYLIGRPQLMLSYVFGGGIVALTVVLLIGLVRWGRRQP